MIVLNVLFILVLLKFRIEFIELFKVIGVDFVGVLLYRFGSGIGKVYVVLFICVSIRVVNLKFCKKMIVEEFKWGLKEFVVWWNVLDLIVSDNVKVF